jgi:hypothetical protein
MAVGAGVVRLAVPVCVLFLFLTACGSQLPPVPPPPPACFDGGAGKLESGVRRYDRGETEMAFEALQASAACGNSDAQVNLGYMYARGDVSAPDQVEAMRLYQLSAAQGNGEGMNAIGYKYAFGSGVPVDLKLAVHWFCKAIEQGNLRGMNNLANLYDNGKGVPKDQGIAQALWQQAADHGHVNSLYNLALTYEADGNTAAKEKAWKMMIKAANGGSAPAQAFLQKNGDKEEFPPGADDGSLMVVQPAVPAAHAPACEQPALAP